MKIYTSYFANLKNIPDDVIPISIIHLSGGRDIVLVCYEGPSKFCHRHLVAEWLNKYGYDVEEWEGEK